MAFYIQIGSGAGDMDSSLNFQDGFTNFIKKKRLEKNDKILLVEANPLIINKLHQCWKDFPNVKIFNLAIVGNNLNADTIDIFYTKDDQPYYQVTSHDIDHVKKHYPKSVIEKISVKSKKISDFLNEEVMNEKIEYLSIDAEGMDFEIIMSMDFTKHNIKYISVEFLHFGKNRKKILSKLADAGYSFKGSGFDINGYDFMFEKKTNIYLKFKTKYFTPSIKKFIKKNYLD